MISFKSRLAVITGAGSGIGRALALALAKEGASLALADINEESVAAVAKEAEAAGAPAARHWTLDVVDENAWRRFADEVEQELGMADLLFNNAGIARMGRFEHTESQAFQKVVDVNFWGVVYGTRAFLPQLKLRQGVFINISSLFGLIGVPGNTHYCASKFAVRGFNESIRQEFAEFGVHVASVHPGGVHTNIANSAEFDEGEEDREALLKRSNEKFLVMPPEKAASIILSGVRKRKHRILVGNDAKLLSFVQRLLPASYPKIMKRFLGGEEGPQLDPGPVQARMESPSLRSRFFSWTIRKNFKGKFADTSKPWDSDKIRAAVEKASRSKSMPNVVCEDINLDGEEGKAGVKGQWQRPASGSNSHTILYLHGGGYVFCSVRTHANMTRAWAEQADAQLFSVDYRLAPENPYPAALEDALAAYEYLLDQGIDANSIVVAGDSAGGGLSTALLLKIKERGLAMPAGALLLSPWVDLAGTGASLEANTDSCAFFTGDMIRRAAEHYVADDDEKNPFISPLYGDLEGLPPIRIYVGNTEVLEDDSLRLFDKAREHGVDAELRVWNDQPHVWPVFYPFFPEAKLTVAEMAEFSQRVTSLDEGVNVSSDKGSEA
ncbi:SDR family NAD(P)-dependent oxidoreductase [Pseudoteredinibacter isoporae]|uniref:Acetyl esterase/lipase/NAD(P)-dependent dehydrogenase (Short-subunit alcohol dehydrogenase family) n=1 Tax=Pseudoteredinibacter isoporae TaxID=570281 RepID=A0A7X0MUB9_9GAMM|nr:SDR family NAD(P)-dependent oxidoreductase [Pseudoteredinibacter isoporae]MBB6520113.1 acetyl esterase/lipase/NAD(P)-dependent dehydrogenase (short-subunit alcohol dehydrogenase family) [Pseudoteredinibacter isoporae]NHO85685.1 SDR family NAD(P)-dependent oxidoreductase [Pseudoteredinibacter isoporae]NIB25863.1 SDR family NAD(P)-dependent oxidoreductase [Pseudoteredinibacter isoporae]